MPNPAELISTQFEAFVSRLMNAGVAAPSGLVGCTDDEIDRLEHKYAIALPASYRLFLQRMGHQSGRLFTHDHVSTDYSCVLHMTEEQARFWKETLESERVTLPADRLVILSRLGEQWLCIRCVGDEDTPVLYYSAAGGEMQESHPSVLEWLNAWREESEAAIAGGYYETYLNGTR